MMSSRSFASFVGGQSGGGGAPCSRCAKRFLLVVVVVVCWTLLACDCRAEETSSSVRDAVVCDDEGDRSFASSLHDHHDDDDVHEHRFGTDTIDDEATAETIDDEAATSETIDDEAATSETREETFEHVLSDVADHFSESFDAVPSNGKIALGVVTGLAATRFAIRVVTRTFKTVGLAFLVSEALKASGVFSKMSEESRDRMAYVSRTAWNEVDRRRSQIGESVDVLRSYAYDAVVRMDRSFKAGVAIGASLGFMV